MAFKMTFEGEKLSIIIEAPPKHCDFPGRRSRQ